MIIYHYIIRFISTIGIWRKKLIVVFKLSLKTISNNTKDQCFSWLETGLGIKLWTFIIFSPGMLSKLNRMFFGVIAKILSSQLIKRREWKKQKVNKLKDFMIRMWMTHSNYLYHPLKSDTLITMKPIKSWVILIRCWYSKILSLWPLMSSAEQSRQSREEDS